MKTKKLVNTLILVVICILIIQMFLSMTVLIIAGTLNNNIVVNITSILIIVSAILLSMFLVKLFELFTGRTFAEVYYRHYFFNKSIDSEHTDKNSD